MKDQILDSLNNPVDLEKIYRENKSSFKEAFLKLYPEIKGNLSADFWYQRLITRNSESTFGTNKQLFLAIFASLTAGLIAKIPFLFNLVPDVFYSKNIGFIVFPILTIYFSWKNKLPLNRIILITVLTFSAFFFINFFPFIKASGTQLLTNIHLPLFLWFVLGIAFTGKKSNQLYNRIDYFKFSADLVVITTIILIAGAILTAITIGLFTITGLPIDESLLLNIPIFGLSATPIIGTYLLQTNSQLVNKISPLIARLFAPLVLLMLTIYLIAILNSGKNPYNDREFLLIFNILLIGVMAIIFFSVTEKSFLYRNNTQILILFLLSVLTLVVNSIAISAIFIRISEWGFTPNRTAIFGANLLILINLILVTIQLFRIIFKKSETTNVGNTIALYMPVYFIWLIVVCFIFPLIF